MDNIGYIQFYTHDPRHRTLCDAGCKTIFEDCDIASGTEPRPGLAEAMATLASGDALVVWSLDQLADSLAHLDQIVTDLEQIGAGLIALQEQIITSGDGGQHFIRILTALATFDHNIRSKGTKHGLEKARHNGKHVGRPLKLLPEQIKHAQKLITSGQAIRTSIAASYNVDVGTLRRALRNL